MEKIIVSIRVRPLSKQEAAKGCPWKLTSNTISLSSGSSTAGQTYNFDTVFGPASRTADIYGGHTRKIISSTVKGFNGTIFAYGQTSSGKTFTMRGSEGEPGIIPLAIQDVFRNIEAEINREFLLRVSYMEIYNEEIKDLLAPENCKLQVHESVERGIFVAGLREEIVVSLEQVLELMENGEAHRHVGETNMNVHSSRSHAILRMVIESRDRSRDDPWDQALLPTSDPVRVSHLNLVDLAGSERVSKTGAEGTRLKEGTHINKSLMTLGNVINKLSEGIEKQGGHVPYRDSKLTRILQPALGGNAKTLIICNITPALDHVDETRGTLHFASRANRVTNCAQVNEILTDAALLKRQKKEIEELRQKLQKQESPSDQLEEEILNLRNELLKTELERERMALELQEFQKAHAERERQIKEQEQKIENLSCMVINSAIDDRTFEKHSKKGNRRETWCARPQSKPPLGLLDLRKHSQKDVPKIESSELSFQVSRERSLGLPPPFETLAEEENGLNMFTRGTGSCFDEDLEEGFCMDGFSIPEPGAQSFVTDRTRRISSECKTANEMEQKLSELEGQYDSLQCDYVIKMQQKDTEIDQLRKELAHCQSSVRKIAMKDIKHCTVLDSGKRAKSLDGWKGSQTIKQLRSQVQKLETEKLYMQRELERVLEQARAQSDSVGQDLEEVYKELSASRKHSTELNVELDRTRQQLQQLQMEKCEDQLAYLQLASALKELRNEVDGKIVRHNELQSCIHESFQLISTNVKAFQECLGDARDLTLLASAVHGKDSAVLHSWKPLAVILEETELEQRSSAGPESLELVEDGGLMEVREIAGVKPQLERKITDGNAKLPGKTDPVLLPLESDKSRFVVNDIDGPVVNGISANTDSEDIKRQHRDDSENKYCRPLISVKQKPDVCAELSWEGAGALLPAVMRNIDVQIEVPISERQRSATTKSALQHDLEKLKSSLEKEKHTLSLTKEVLEEGVVISTNEVHRLETESEIAECKKHHHEDLEDGKLIPNEKPSSLEAKIAEGNEDRMRLSETLACFCGEMETVVEEKWMYIPGNSAMEEKLEGFKSNLKLVEEQNSCTRVSEEAIKKLEKHEVGIEKLLNKLIAARSISPRILGSEELVEQHGSSMESGNIHLEILEGEVDWAVEELHYLHETLDLLHSAVRWTPLASTEEERLLLRESALQKELHDLKVSLKWMEDENNALSRISLETQHELERVRTGMAAIAERIETADHNHSSIKEHMSISSLGAEVDRLLTKNKGFKVSLDGLCDSVQHSRKERDRLLWKEGPLVEEFVLLKSSLEAVGDNDKNLTRPREDIWSEVERQRMELEDTARKLQSTTKDYVEAREEIFNLKFLLSQNRGEQVDLKKRLKQMEEEKDTLNRTIGEHERQVQQLAVACEEMEGSQKQHYYAEAARYRADIASLRKELATVKAAPGALVRERDCLHKDLEKTKFRIKEIEAKLKTTIQEKSKLETEKVNLEREVKQSRQSTVLQRDISRRDSIVDQRRQSMALDSHKAKNQMKTDEVEKLRHDLIVSQQLYAKLEFGMAESESYLKESIAELERDIAMLKEEKDRCATIAELRINEMELAMEQCRAKSTELDDMKTELLSMRNKLHETEVQIDAAGALTAQLSKEKENMIQELVDAHMLFHKEKAELLFEVQESRKKCNILNLDNVQLSEELQKVNILREENLDANRLLEEKFQQALEASSEKCLRHLNELKQLRVDIECHKERCRELEKYIELGSEREHELRSSASSQVEQLRDELQQCRINLSTAHDVEQMSSVENQSLLIANTKVLFGLVASRCRMEVFEGRWEESEWDLRVQGVAYEEKIRYLESKLVTAEQGNRVQELVHENQKLEAQKLREVLKAKENHLTGLLTTMESLSVQNLTLERDLLASQSELQSAQQLTRIAMRVGAIEKCSTPSFDSFREGKLEPSLKSLPLEDYCITPALIEQSNESNQNSTQVIVSNRGNSSIPYNSERKRARIFPTPGKPKDVERLLHRQHCPRPLETQYKKLGEALKVKEDSQTAFQGNLLQSLKLGKELPASETELESAQQYKTIEVGAGALGKISAPFINSLGDMKLQSQPTSNSFTLEHYSMTAASREESKENSPQISVPSRRNPLSRYNSERKYAHMFLSSEKPNDLGAHFTGNGLSSSQVYQNKENIK